MYVGGQRLLGRCAGLTQVKNAVGGSGDRAKGWVATTTQANDLAVHTVLLSGELHGEKCGSKKLVGRGGGLIKPCVSKGKFDIGIHEGLCFGRSAGVPTTNSSYELLMVPPGLAKDTKESQMLAGNGCRQTIGPAICWRAL